MKKFLTRSVLFVALFTTIATNNTAKAQPASFTQDFLQEDYRNGLVVRTNKVTVVWDASTNLLTFRNFYSNPLVNDEVVNLVFPSYATDTSSPTTLTWESDTKANFTWRASSMGQSDVFATLPFSYASFRTYKAAVMARFRHVSSPARIYDPVNNTLYTTSYYAYYGGQDCHGTIDVASGTIEITDPWGCVVGNNNWNTMSASIVIEYFERSEMHIIKTDLVDIVNDGSVDEEYTVNDDLVGVVTVDGVLSSPMSVSRNQNSFMIERGRYKLDLDLSSNDLTVSQSTQDITGFVNNGSHPTYYVLGQANDNDWNPTVGQPMETTDGVHYRAVVNFDGRDDNKNYFSLTSGLANNNDQGGWDYVNGSCRLGPSYNDYPVTMGNVLFAKDMGKYKYPSQISDGQIDFLGRVEAEYMGNTKLQPVVDFDQSNWVMLTDVANADNYVGKIIKGKSITGKLVDKVNPTIAVTSTPEVGDPNPYDPNIYIIPSFNEAYYAPNSHFFFVAPKVQEYAYITWACYNAADGNFYTMSDGNVDNLSGGIKVNWDYFPSGNPQDGYVYEFDAILRKVAPATSSAPLLKDGNQSNPVTDDLSTDYIVYPLRLYDVPTAINTVEATGKAVDVKYYNMMGIESSTPFNGVNIVVTTYDNGTRSNTKKLFK